MQEQTRQRIKPIIPRKTFVDTKQSYNQFLKKGYRILPGVKISLGNDKYHRYFSTLQMIGPRPETLRLFKTFKYAQKFDFRPPRMVEGQFSCKKILYFAKKMSNSHTVSIGDLTRLFPPWARCMKRARIFQYQIELPPPKRHTTFVHQHMKSYSHLKNLTIQFPADCWRSWNEKREIKHFPSSLEHLSIQQVNNNQANLPSSFTNLKNLKHFEITSGQPCTYLFIASILQLLSPLAPHLQSLSLRFPFSLQNPIPVCVKSLCNLSKLKLNIPHSFKPEELSVFQKNLHLFQDCPLEHLSLKLSLTSAKLLPPISRLLQKTAASLKSLRLHIFIPNLMNNFNPVRQMLQQIDELPLITRLSIKIKIQTQAVTFPELPTLFTKIFTKPIPLETFKIKLHPFELSKKGFLSLLKSLEPRASTLTKLKIGIGVYKAKNKEFSTVFNFIKSLQNIRSLKLKSIVIAKKQFLIEFTEAICGLLYLTVLKIGGIERDVTKSALITHLKKLLQKKGLAKFDFQVDEAFRKEIKRVPPKIDQGKIEKENPSIRHFPGIHGIFFVKENDEWGK